MASSDTPRTLGRYEIVDLLGRGGMGSVHLARMRGIGGFVREVGPGRRETLGADASLQIRVPRGDKERWTKAAKARGESLSEVVRSALGARYDHRA